MLNVEELMELEEKFRKTIAEKSEEILSKLNRDGKLEEVLELLGLADLLVDDCAYKPYKTGKVFIVGQCEVKMQQLLGLIKCMGFDKNRFEFCLDYDDVKRFYSGDRKILWSLLVQCHTKHAVQVIIVVLLKQLLRDLAHLML